MSQKIIIYVTMWMLLLSFLKMVKEPKSLVTLRERYTALREEFAKLPEGHKFRKLRTHSIGGIPWYAGRAFRFQHEQGCRDWSVC